MSLAMVFDDPGVLSPVIARFRLLNVLDYGVSAQNCLVVINFLATFIFHFIVLFYSEGNSVLS